MTADNIIKKFELYVDDATELSSDQELELLNKIYRQVWADRPWEFAKKGYSGVINGNNIALPTDFAYIYENGNYTNNQERGLVNNSAQKLVYVNDSPKILVNWSDRNQYDGRDGYCWIDYANDKLYFSITQSGTVTYDYIFFPEDLKIDDEPLFPAMFHDILYHGMASEDYVIQQFDKAKSYATENQSKYNDWLERMAMWNSNLLNN